MRTQLDGREGGGCTQNKRGEETQIMNPGSESQPPKAHYHQKGNSLIPAPGSSRAVAVDQGVLLYAGPGLSVLLASAAPGQRCYTHTLCLSRTHTYCHPPCLFTMREFPHQLPGSIPRPRKPGLVNRAAENGPAAPPSHRGLKPSLHHLKPL